MALDAVWRASSSPAVPSASFRSRADSNARPASWSVVPDGCPFSGALGLPASAGAATKAADSAAPSRTGSGMGTRSIIRVIFGALRAMGLRLNRNHRHDALGPTGRDLDGMGRAHDLSPYRIVHHELVTVGAVREGHAP